MSVIAQFYVYKKNGVSLNFLSGNYDTNVVLKSVDSCCLNMTFIFFLYICVAVEIEPSRLYTCRK